MFVVLSPCSCRLLGTGRTPSALNKLLNVGRDGEIGEGFDLGQLRHALGLDELLPLSLDVGVFHTAPNVQLRLEGLGQCGVDLLGVETRHFPF